MKIHNVEQGSPEWYALRLSIPTASEFSKILTPKRLELSAQHKAYAYRLVTQELLGYPLQSLDGLEHIDNGKILEPEAVKRYEFDHEVETVKVGFITTDDGKVGCSPDRLVDKTGLLEIKCPAPQTLVGCICEGIDDAYVCQKQGQLYIAEREWADVFFYHPQFQPVEKRYYRDEKFITALSAALKEFNEKKDEMMEKVKKHGFFSMNTDVVGVVDIAYQDNLEPIFGETA